MATVPPYAATPSRVSAASALRLAEAFFVFDTSNGVADLRETLLQFEARSLPRRTPIIGQGTADRQAVAADRFGLGVASLLQRTFEGAHASDVRLQLRDVLPIRFVERIDGILEVMKLTELMRCLGEDKGHCAADGFLPIRDDPFDRYL